MDTNQSIVQNDDVKDDSKGSMPTQFIVNSSGDSDVSSENEEFDHGQGDSDVNSENAEPMLQLGLGGGSESYPERRRLKRPRHQGQGDSDVDSENAEPMLQLGLGGGSELYPERRRSKRPRHQAPLIGFKDFCKIQAATPSDRGLRIDLFKMLTFACEKQAATPCAATPCAATPCAATPSDHGLRNDYFRMSTFDPRRRDSIVPNEDGSQVEQGDSGGGGSIATQIIEDSNRASSGASLSTPRSHHLPNNSQQVVHIESLPTQLAQREQVIQEKNVQINAPMQTDSSGTSVAGQNHRKRWSKVLKAWIGLTKKKQPRGTKKPNHHGN